VKIAKEKKIFCYENRKVSSIPHHAL